MNSTHSIPMALYHVVSGLTDLHEAIRAARTVEECMRIYQELSPLVSNAEAIQLLALRRATDLLQER